MLSDPKAHLDFVRGMARARAHGTASSTLLSFVKYLGVYLAEGMRIEQRREAILFHHAFLASVIARDSWNPPPIIWTGDSIEPRLGVVLRTATLSPMEGEHELVFMSDDRPLCTLTFAIVSGRVLGLEDGTIIFIGGVQGAVAAREAIRVAAKANGEIAPSAMLMIAAKALAQVFGIPRIVGVPSDLHPAREYAAARMSLDYDRLWYDAGATLTEGAWFSLHPRKPEKPLESVSRDHRARTRRKRERKMRIFEDIVSGLTYKNGNKKIVQRVDS